MRANAVGTEVWPAYEVTSENADSSFDIRYLEGPKQYLDVHFFAAAELENLFESWDPVLPLVKDAQPRRSGPGTWIQWEAIWRRTD